MSYSNRVFSNSATWYRVRVQVPQCYGGKTDHWQPRKFWKSMFEKRGIAVEMAQCKGKELWNRVVRHRSTNMMDIFSWWQIRCGRRRERGQKKQLSLNWKSCHCCTHHFNFDWVFFIESRVLGKKYIWNKKLGVSFWKLRQSIQIILACVGFSSTWNSTKSHKSIDYFHATESASFHGKCFRFKYLSNIISKRDFCHDRNYSRKCLVFLVCTLHNIFCIIQIFFCYIPLQ